MKKGLLILLFLVLSLPAIAHPPDKHHDDPPPPPPPVVPVATYTNDYQAQFEGCDRHFMLVHEITTQYSDNTTSVARTYSVIDNNGYTLVSNASAVEHLDNDFEHYFLICSGGHYGIIDSYGVLTTTEYYNTAVMLDYNRIKVSKNLSFMKVGYGVIDYSGKEVIPVKYQAINSGKLNNGIYKTKLNGYWGLITLDNTVVARNENDSIKELLYTYKVKKEGKFGLIGMNGQKILDTTYDKIDTLGSSYIIVKKGNLWAAYDAYGNNLAPFRYKKIKLERNVLKGDTGRITETIAR